LALHLVERGWDVGVYCQENSLHQIREEMWNGVRRILVPSWGESALASIYFDLRSILHARRHFDNCLTLGYNTAVFNLILKLSGKRTIMNMDGIEWLRAKWSPPARLWLWANEWLGAKISDQLVADHPEISLHLQRHTAESKIHTIAYGTNTPSSPDPAVLAEFRLEPGRYALLIARAVPENSILEIVRSWGIRKRGIPLLVLGTFHIGHPYHDAVLAHASDEIRFVGAIYDKIRIQSLRWHSSLYLHGHKVGGTNPSLIEALSCGNPVIAHDNRFNRWVAGDAALYFSNESECATRMDLVLADQSLRSELSKNAFRRHKEAFTLSSIHKEYENLCLRTFDYESEIRRPPALKRSQSEPAATSL
jgi:glycosyltransferase involved in cell wall biosynthesis